MGINVPPAKNYTSPIVSFPAAWANPAPPPEGPRLIPFEIDWGPDNMGGPNGCVSINLFGGAAQTFSRIVALSVDNSQCAADITFIFPDTAQTYNVAAYSPAAVFPVFTNATAFFVSSPQSEDSDTTRFSVHNTMPPPVALPLSQEQQTEVFNDIAVASGSTQLIPAGTNGTLEGATVGFQFVATACNVAWVLQDGNGDIVAGGQAAASPQANDNAYVQSLNLNGIRVRFQNGLKFIQTITGSGTNALVAINVYYRTP